MARNGRERVWRGVRRGALFVGLGLTTSVVVAWFCVLLPFGYSMDTCMGDGRRSGSGLSGEQTEVVGFGYDTHRVHALTTVSGHRIGLYSGAPSATELPVSRFGLPQWTNRFLEGRLWGNDDPYSVQAGWPMRCLGCVRQSSDTRLIGGFVIPESWADRLMFRDVPTTWFPPVQDAVPKGVFPYLPLMPGIVFNTLIYGAAWFAPFVTVRLIKRTRYGRRVRRGRCPNCRYDLSGRFEVGCPECGWNRTQPDQRWISVSIASRRRRRRPLRRIVVYLTLGVTTSFFVAWACAVATINPRIREVPWTLDFHNNIAEAMGTSRLDAIGVRAQTWLMRDFEVWTPRWEGKPTLEDYGVPQWAVRWIGSTPVRPLEIPATIEAGWPMRAFGGIDYSDACGCGHPRSPGLLKVDLPDVLNRPLAAGLYADEDWAGYRLCLPFRPRFPGFIVNTLFYAALWFGIVAALHGLLVRNRTRRGKCCSADAAGR